MPGGLLHCESESEAFLKTKEVGVFKEMFGMVVQGRGRIQNVFMVLCVQELARVK